MHAQGQRPQEFGLRLEYGKAGHGGAPVMHRPSMRRHPPQRAGARRTLGRHAVAQRGAPCCVPAQSRGRRRPRRRRAVVSPPPRLASRAHTREWGAARRFAAAAVLAGHCFSRPVRWGLWRPSRAVVASNPTAKAAMRASAPRTGAGVATGGLWIRRKAPVSAVHGGLESVWPYPVDVTRSPLPPSAPFTISAPPSAAAPWSGVHLAT